MPDLYSLHQESNRILNDIALATRKTEVDQADLERRVAENRLGIDQVKEHLESIEAVVTDDVLAQDGLKNEAQRKSAISKALAANEAYRAANEDLRQRQYYLRIAEADVSQAQAQRSATNAQMLLLGKAADLVSHHLHLLARERELEAAQTRLKGLTQHVK